MKKYLIPAYTEILNDNINNVQDFMRDNFELLIDGIVGASTGVVKGLDTNILDSNARTVTTISGATCNGNGVFYELLDTVTTTLPSTDGTYIIYAVETQKLDGAISGWTLIDVANQIESYETHSTRQYDGLNISFYNQALGSLVQNKQDIYRAIISGGVLTQLDDIRSYISLGNILSNSLQQFYIEGTNYVFESNKITGTVLKTDEVGKKIGLDIKVSDSYFTQAINLDLGNNIQTTGILIDVDNNIGSLVNVNNNGIGSLFKGNGGNEKLLSLKGARVGVELENCLSGVTIVGQNTTDTGLRILNNKKNVELIGDNSLSITGTTSSTTTDKLVNLYNRGEGKALSIVSNKNGTITPSAIEILTDNTTNAIYVGRNNISGLVETAISINHSMSGIVINNVASGSALVINGNGSNDNGIILNNVANGLSVISSGVGYSTIMNGNDLLVTETTRGFVSNINESGIGFDVLFNSDVTKGVGLNIRGTQVVNTAITGILISSPDLSGSVGRIQQGIRLNNCTSGVVITNDSVTMGVKLVNGNIEMNNGQFKLNDLISTPDTLNGLDNTLIIDRSQGIRIKHISHTLEIETKNSNWVSYMRQYTTDSPNLLLFSNNLHTVFQGFQTLNDLQTPSITYFGTDKVTPNRKAGLTVAYNSDTMRYSLFFFNGNDYLPLAQVSNVAGANHLGDIPIETTDGTSLSLVY